LRGTWGIGPGAIALALATACGAATPPPAVVTTPAEPRWQDVFDATPELLVVVRPRALRQDKVYGPLSRRAVELAREQSRIVAATGALEALEDSDDVIAGVRPESPDHPAELVLVEQGVPAELDPGKLVDAEGRPLWAPGPSGAVRELVRERDEHGATIAASLFELPGRVWVIASGGARDRARDVFGRAAHAPHRPKIELDREALVIVRLDGPSLVGRVRPLQGSGALSVVGRHLRSAELLLPPGGESVLRATLSYADEDSAAVAEVALREAVEAIHRSAQRQAPEERPPQLDRSWLALLGGAQVARPQGEQGEQGGQGGQGEQGKGGRSPLLRQVVVTAPLPASLVGALLHAGSARLP